MIESAESTITGPELLERPFVTTSEASAAQRTEPMRYANEE